MHATTPSIYVSTEEKAWITWLRKVEEALPFQIDSRIGSDAYDIYCEGATPSEAAKELVALSRGPITVKSIPRSLFKRARRVLRENGRHGLRFLPVDVACVMEMAIDAQNERDWLAERADIIAYCQREGFACNVRHTQRSEQ